MKTLKFLRLLLFVEIAFGLNIPVLNAMITDLATGKITKLDQKMEDELYSCFNHENTFIENGAMNIIKKYPKLDPNYKFSNRGEYILSLAAGKFFHNLCNYLIAEGANVKLVNDNGDTALHAACRSTTNADKQFYIIKMLVDAGADLYAKDVMGNTPLDMMNLINEHMLGWLFNKSAYNYIRGKM
jgi:Ankyrin repeat.